MTADYEGAILTKEELEIIIILGLSVECWDVDMSTIHERWPTESKPGIRGHFILFKGGIGQYAKWFGFDDPTYNALAVMSSKSDDEIDKAEAAHASMYMFNTREEAVNAQIKHREALQKKRQDREKFLKRNAIAWEYLLD